MVDMDVQNFGRSMLQQNVGRSMLQLNSHRLCSSSVSRSSARMCKGKPGCQFVVEICTDLIYIGHYNALGGAQIFVLKSLRACRLSKRGGDVRADHDHGMYAERGLSRMPNVYGMHARPSGLNVSMHLLAWAPTAVLKTLGLACLHFWCVGYPYNFVSGHVCDRRVLEERYDTDNI